MESDVLFINPDGLGKVYGKLASEVMTIEPPVWAMMLSQAIKAKGYKTKILDCILDNSSPDEIISAVKLSNPKLIVMVVYGQHPSASTHTMYGAAITTKLIKKSFPKINVLYVGGHVSALPEKTILEEPCDFAAKGEGTDTIIDLLKADQGDELDLLQVRGLYFKVGDEVMRGRAAEVKRNGTLDDVFPGLDFTDLDVTKYRAPNWFLFGDLGNRAGYASVYTSLGCPYDCSFCCINAPFGEKLYRVWSTDLILDQFTHFHEKGIYNVKIADELFIIKPSHYVPICEGIIERGYKFNMWAFARVDSIKKEHLPLLKKAGINWLILGIETFSDDIRDGVSKGQYSKAEIKQVIKDIQEAGIFVHGNFLFGMPDDDIKSMQDNLNFSLELEIETANFYCMMPYPGSDLYDLAVKNKVEMPKDWLSYSQHGYDSMPLPTKHLSREEVLTFRDQAWEIYHKDSKYLEMMDKKFGKETLDYITELTKVKLERKYFVEKQLANERVL